MNCLDELRARIAIADKRYGYFASTHEALGVALEEWNELGEAVQLGALGRVREESLDLAAALIRLADALDSKDVDALTMRARSVR
jgi:NTP pyrophosphatase (non-canonical NTP hydrolase)